MARTSIAERNKDRIAGDRRATARPGQAFATEYRVRAGLLLAVFGHQCRPDNTVRKPLERHPGPALAWPHESRSRRLLQRHPRARRPLRRTLLHRGQDHAHLLPSGLSGAHALSRNVVFYATAAAAGAGFHPCLRCRPEIAPAAGPAPGLPASVARALQLIELGALDDGDLDALAARTGVGARQLRRQFREHLGASPVAVAQTRRVLLAKQLIHETRLPMAEIAFASGFGSIRRFNERFQQLFDRPPGALRRSSQPDVPAGPRRDPAAAALSTALRLGRDAGLPAAARHRRHRTGAGTPLHAQHQPGRRAGHGGGGTRQGRRAAGHRALSPAAIPARDHRPPAAAIRPGQRSGRHRGAAVA